VHRGDSRVKRESPTKMTSLVLSHGAGDPEQDRGDSRRTRKARSTRKARKR